MKERSAASLLLDPSGGEPAPGRMEDAAVPLAAEFGKGCEAGFMVNEAGDAPLLAAIAPLGFAAVLKKGGSREIALDAAAQIGEGHVLDEGVVVAGEQPPGEERILVAIDHPVIGVGLLVEMKRRLERRPVTPLVDQDLSAVEAGVAPGWQVAGVPDRVPFRDVDEVAPEDGTLGSIFGPVEDGCRVDHGDLVGVEKQHFGKSRFHQGVDLELPTVMDAGGPAFQHDFRIDHPDPFRLQEARHARGHFFPAEMPHLDRKRRAEHPAKHEDEHKGVDEDLGATGGHDDPAPIEATRRARPQRRHPLLEECSLPNGGVLRHAGKGGRDLRWITRRPLAWRRRTPKWRRRAKPAPNWERQGACYPWEGGRPRPPFSSPQTWRVRFAKWRAGTPALPGRLLHARKK